MNKSDFVRVVAKKSGFTNGNAKVAVDAVFDALYEILVNGEKFNQPAFGKFYIFESKPRTVKSVVSGKMVEVPSKRHVKFKAAKSFKDIVNK